LTDERAEILAARVLASRLAADEESRIAGDRAHDSGYARHEMALAEVEIATTLALARGRYETVAEAAQDWLEGE
jgi:hypothetical protein